MFEKESQLKARDIYLAVEQLGGVDFIEELQNFNQMYELASNIIVKYGMGEGFVIANGDNSTVQANEEQQQ